MAQWEGMDTEPSKGLEISRAEWEACAKEIREFLKQNSVDEVLMESKDNETIAAYAEIVRQKENYPALRSQVLRKLFDFFAVKVDDFITKSEQSERKDSIKDLAVKLGGARSVTDGVDNVGELGTQAELQTADELLMGLMNSIPTSHSGTSDLTLEIIRYLLGETASYAEIKLFQYPDYKEDKGLDMPKSDDEGKDNLYGELP